MNAKHRKTLEAIFGSPMPKAMPFRHVESLLRALGCTIKEGYGSSVTFAKNGVPLTMHRPHPGNTAQEYQIRLVRAFLRDTGVQP